MIITSADIASALRQVLDSDERVFRRGLLLDIGGQRYEFEDVIDLAARRLATPIPPPGAVTP